MINIQSIKNQLKVIFSNNSLATSALLISCTLPKVFPDEEELIKYAVKKRKVEFRAGRICAHAALQKLNITPIAIFAKSDRSLVCPTGSFISISHTQKLAVAVAGLSLKIKSVGIDIETINRFHNRLWRFILTQNEQSWIKKLKKDSQNRFVALIFSAKECYYKLQYPITQKLLGFLDVEIKININSNSFFMITVNQNKNFLKLKSQFKGYFFFENNFVVTGMYLI